MATSYPAGLDTYSRPTGSGTLADDNGSHSAHHDNAYDAIEAIETELGVAPSGAAATVAARFTAAETATSDHLADAADAHAASAITNTPAGAIAATTVQAALNELDTDKQADVITTRGDLVVGNAATDASRLALGAADTVLHSDGTDAAWTASLNGLSLTNVGELTFDDSAAPVVVGPENGANGIRFGTATSDKFAFHGATPTNQCDAYTQTYSTADRTHAARTAIALTVTDGVGTNDGTIGAITADASVIAAVQELAAAINALRVDHLDTASVVNAVVDDLQEKGLVG